MSYSKDSERQNKVLGDLISGRTPDKRIQVGYDGDKDGKAWEKQGDRIDRLSEIMKEARMPMFCPNCDKVMKKRLDNKMWLLYNQCFDCQIDFENKLRIKGEYEEWEKSKVKANQKAYLEDLLVSLEEWKGANIEYQEQVGVQDLEMEKEKWTQNKEHMDEMASKAEEFIRKTLKEIE
jgi:ribosomal protein L37AE/L43A|tara:strand:- start:1036 stop:1569 length:534 start_codon:yes stop_codon:yes gene_type:complete